MTCTAGTRQALLAHAARPGCDAIRAEALLSGLRNLCCAAAKAFKKKVAARAAADVARAKEEAAAVQSELEAVRLDSEQQRAASLAHQQDAAEASTRAAAQLVRPLCLPAV